MEKSTLFVICPSGEIMTFNPRKQSMAEVSDILFDKLGVHATKVQAFHVIEGEPLAYLLPSNKDDAELVACMHNN